MRCGPTRSVGEQRPSGSAECRVRPGRPVGGRRRASTGSAQRPSNIYQSMAEYCVSVYAPTDWYRSCGPEPPGRALRSPRTTASGRGPPSRAHVCWVVALARRGCRSAAPNHGGWPEPDGAERHVRVRPAKRIAGRRQHRSPWDPVGQVPLWVLGPLRCFHASGSGGPSISFTILTHDVESARGCALAGRLTPENGQLLGPAGIVGDRIVRHV